MNLRVERIESLDELKQAREEWNALAGSFPFHRWEWQASWQESFCDQASPFIVVVKDSDRRWLGIAPFCLTQRRDTGRTLELLSSGRACGDYLNLLCRPGYDLIVFDWLADWLTEESRRRGGFDTLILEGVDAHNPGIALLKQRLVEHRFTPHESQVEGCWELELASTWDALNMSFSKKHRRKTKKAVQRLEDPATVVRTSRKEGVEAIWPVFTQLHQQRRTSLGEAGCFADQAFDRFLFSATEQLAEEGLAEVVVLEFEGKPFGGMLLFNDGEGFYMYQSGLDPEEAGREPGYQLIVWALQEGIRRGYDRFDFLRGDEPYKSRWKTVRKALHRVKLVAPKWKSKIRHQIWLSGKSIKGWWQAQQPHAD